MTNPYCTLAALKLELGVPLATRTEDAQLLAAIVAASRQIDGYCGRRFWQDRLVVTRLYHASSPTVCETDDISTATGLVVKIDLQGYGVYDITLAITTDFMLYPQNAALEVPARPFEEIHIVPFAQYYFARTMRPGVQVTAKFGWPAVPDDVTKAALLQAGQLYKAKDAIFGVAAFGDFGPMRVKARLNPIAEGLLGEYRKDAIG